jgi:hypothetical protein
MRVTFIATMKHKGRMSVKLEIEVKTIRTGMYQYVPVFNGIYYSVYLTPVYSVYNHQFTYIISKLEFSRGKAKIF